MSKQNKQLNCDELINELREANVVPVFDRVIESFFLDEQE